MHLIDSFVILLFSFTMLDGLKTRSVEDPRLDYFDTDLLKLTAEDRVGNVIISPASIKTTLGMLLEGASGKTGTEIIRALRLSPEKEEFRTQLNKYLSTLKIDAPDTDLKNGNLVAISKFLNLKKEYESIVKDVYMAGVSKVDFGDPITASAAINNWVNDSTGGLIPSIVEPGHISPSTNIFLSNTLYFKSSWQNVFNPDWTHPLCFRVQETCRTVAMMELHTKLNYAFVDNLRAHAVELPYKGARHSMILLVPAVDVSVTAVIRDLPYMSLSQISQMLEPTDVDLFMPKFDLKFREDMVEPLQSMGITSLFSSKSNLSGLFEGESMEVKNIFHQVQISVDESGTIAAGASGVVLIPLIDNRVRLTVNRPFVFFIRDNTDGLILFEGKIEEPTLYVEPLPEVTNRINSNDTEVLQKVDAPTTKRSLFDRLKSFFG